MGAKEPQDLFNYGDELSGWWLLWNRVNPLRPTLKIPDMQEISARLNYISCNMQLNEVNYYFFKCIIMYISSAESSIFLRIF